MVHELIERFDAHLTADQYFSVIANMKGTSPEDVATRLMNVPGLEGLQVCFECVGICSLLYFARGCVCVVCVCACFVRSLQKMRVAQLLLPS